MSELDIRCRGAARARLLGALGDLSVYTQGGVDLSIRGALDVDGVVVESGEHVVERVRRGTLMVADEDGVGVGTVVVGRDTWTDLEGLIWTVVQVNGRRMGLWNLGVERREQGAARGRGRRDGV